MGTSSPALQRQTIGGAQIRDLRGFWNGLSIEKEPPETRAAMPATPRLGDAKHRCPPAAELPGVSIPAEEKAGRKRSLGTLPFPTITLSPRHLSSGLPPTTAAGAFVGS